MENEKTIYEEWRDFFKKGYDENGKAQYLDMTDPFVEKVKIRHYTMVLNGSEQYYYENLQRAILDHNSAIYEMESKREKIENKQKALDERMRILEEKDKILDERMKVLDDRMQAPKEIEKLRKE